MPSDLQDAGSDNGYRKSASDALVLEASAAAILRQVSERPGRTLRGA
jgi:hypothetical protein